MIQILQMMKKPSQLYQRKLQKLLNQLLQRRNHPQTIQIHLMKRRPNQPRKQQCLQNLQRKKESSSDDSDSSEEEEAKPVVTKKPAVPTKPVTSKKDSSSDDSSDSVEEPTPKKVVATKKTVAAKKDSSSDSDSSDEDEEPVKKVAPEASPKAGEKRKAVSSSDDSDSDSDSNNTTAPVSKKGKFVTSTPAPAKAVAATPSPDDSSAESNDPVNAPPEGTSDSGIEEDKKKAEDKFASKRKSNTPFRRVVAEEIEVDPRLADNSANSSFDTWGAKATQDLIVTKGKSFRHEKTKKKRGSYKGGPINMGVASFKFEDC